MDYLVEDDLEIGPNGTSLDLLQAVYRNPALPLPTRMRAASIAIAYESPKLAVTAQITEQSFAELLERRLNRIADMENGKAKQIEARPVPVVETSNPKPHIADRRYRRM